MAGLTERILEVFGLGSMEPGGEYAAKYVGNLRRLRYDPRPARIRRLINNNLNHIDTGR
jgi:hypothetical protein